ncbi:peptidoglycan-binding protein [Shouchella shacheensis]|uniref:peptidoglycan-binding protein n=1 Tax=Shouchella shacheensis TaxID=1649580 RepID=UPI00073FD989|nr:peptidoglycan-binding protein [Shouchella shacheensis]
MKRWLRTFLATVSAAVIIIVAPGEANAEGEGFNPIHKGAQGEEVQALQEKLADRGYLGTEQITGVFESGTKEAVVSYQESQGLIVDGVAGVQTLGAMSVLQQGEVGVLVSSLQSRLQSLGYYPADIDGHYGPITKQAVLDFQARANIQVDGVAGPETHKQLYYGNIPTATAEETAPSEHTSDSSESTANNENGEESTAVADTEVPSENSEAQTQAPSSEPSAESTEQAVSSEDSSGDSENQSPSEATSQPSENASTSQGSEESAEVASSEASAENAETESSSDVSGATYQMEATAYTAYCNGCSGTTATGIDLRSNPNQKVVAVDPNVIPLGSRVYVEGYGEAIAGDTGGAIKGQKIDLFVETKDEAFSFGRQQVNVTVID